MSKRLVICCDGTWNTPDETNQGVPVATNVTKMALAMADRDSFGVEQQMFYTRGVGTGRYDHWLGGGLGVGLSDKIQEAYMFVVDNFEVGDELFLFGSGTQRTHCPDLRGELRCLVSRGDLGGLPGAAVTSH